MSKACTLRRSVTQVPSVPEIKASVRKEMAARIISKKSQEFYSSFNSEKSVNDILNEKEYSLKLLKHEYEIKESERRAERRRWESQIIKLAKEAGENPHKYLAELKECLFN